MPGASAGSQSQNEKERCKGSSGGDRGEQAVLRPSITLLLKLVLEVVLGISCGAT